MLVREIDGRWGPIGPILIHAGIVHIPESHVDVGIVLIPGSRVDVDVGTVCVHTDVSIGVRIPRRSDSPTMLLWML